MITASTKVDADALKAITAFKAVTGTTNKVVGYVATASGSSGELSVTDVKATIDNYLTLYPGVLDGFFLDGMSTDSNRLAYFQDIYSYVQGKGSYKVIGNPGTYPQPPPTPAPTLARAWPMYSSHMQSNAAAYQNH